MKHQKNNRMKRIVITTCIVILSLTIHSQNNTSSMKKLLAEYTFKHHFQPIDSIEISYVKEGNGTETLLFIHGLSSNLDAWSKNIETLKNKYTCIAIDLPGYGRSSKPDASYTPGFYADIIYKFITKQQLKNVIIIGHSMGGQASIKLTNRYPEIVKKMILIAPAGLEVFSEASAKLMKTTFTASLVKNTTNEQIEKNYSLNFFKQPKEVDKMIHDRKQIKKASDFDAHCKAIVKSVSGMLDDPVSDELKNIEQRTLVLFGENDLLIPNRYFHPDLTVKKIGDIALKKIKHAKVIYVKESGHFLQFEKPKEVNQLIQEFIDK